MIKYGVILGVTAATTAYFERSLIYQKFQTFLWKRKIPVDYKAPRLVILGSGWGAIGILQRLVPGFYKVSVISPQNYFLFTPLLPSATVGTLDVRVLVESIRKIVKRCQGEYVCAKAVDVDLKEKRVWCVDGEGRKFPVEYDKLVIAVGAQTNTFGVEGVTEHAHFLKNINDARRIHKNIVENYEKASLPTVSDEERRRLLTFVVVGGGPTGVEFAAELYDFVHEDLQKYVPERIIKEIRVEILQNADHILNSFDEKISEYTENLFSRSGMRLVKNAQVVRLKEGVMFYRDMASGTMNSQPFGMCVWATGIGTVPFVQEFVRKIPEQSHERGIVVNANLQVKGVEDVYAIGDCASIELPLLEPLLADAKDLNSAIARVASQHPELQFHMETLRKMLAKSKKTLTQDTIRQLDMKLKSLPATAQVASQEGKYLATQLNNQAKNKILKLSKYPQRPFVYHHYGMSAYVGQRHAIVDIGSTWFGDQFLGLLLWRSIYLNEQVAFRTRFIVAMGWIRKFLFGRDTSSF